MELAIFLVTASVVGGTVYYIDRRTKKREMEEKRIKEHAENAVNGDAIPDKPVNNVSKKPNIKIAD